MSIISKSDIYRFGDTSRSKFSTINENLSNFSKESKVDKTTVFLSHKHNELRELEGAVAFLKEMKIDLYVDWMDVEMPKETSGETAQRLKLKIRSCNKFILLATEDAIASKWCNWELGYGDSLKFLDNMAILPLKDDDRSYTGSEYLQIYSRIEYVKSFSVSRKIGGYFDEGYYVVTPSHSDGGIRYIKIEKWLSQG